MLQREAKAYQHCKHLQYQVLPGVLAAGPAMRGQHTCLQHVFCLWLASQTVRQPSIKQCMLSRPCMVCGYYMGTSEKATFCVYLSQYKPAGLYSLI